MLENSGKTSSLDMNSDYFLAVGLLARTEDTLCFENSGPSHAAAVMYHLFDNAQSRVDVFSGALNWDRGLLEVIKKFLKDKNAKMRIIVEDESDPAQILHELRGYYNVTAKKANEGFLKVIQSALGGNTYHMAIADEKSYRYEIDTEKSKAYCCYNDRETAKRLQDLFNSAYERLP